MTDVLEPKESTVRTEHGAIRWFVGAVAMILCITAAMKLHGLLTESFYRFTKRLVRRISRIRRWCGNCCCHRFAVDTIDASAVWVDHVAVWYIHCGANYPLGSGQYGLWLCRFRQHRHSVDDARRLAYRHLRCFGHSLDVSATSFHIPYFVECAPIHPIGGVSAYRHERYPRDGFPGV